MNFELPSCQIDATSMWRPGFSDVVARLRISYFPDKLLVTRFDDANEESTNSLVLYNGNHIGNWRHLIPVVTTVNAVASYNPDWYPDDMPFNHPKDLSFDPTSFLAVRLVGIAWLGTPWSEIVRALMIFSDEKILELDDGKRGGVTKIIEDLFTALDVFYSDYEGDETWKQFLSEVVEVVAQGGDALEAAEKLAAKV